MYQGIPETKQALPKNVAYVMTQMLKYNVKAAPGLTGLKSEVGGKTGTTNDYRDGWFMGVTPRLVVGTWVGGEDQWIRFLTIADGQGSAMARPFFAKMMARLEKSSVSYDANARFVKPEGDLRIVLDCSQYQEIGPSGLPTEAVPSEFDPNRFQDEEQSSRAPAPTVTPLGKPTTPTTPLVPQKKKPKTVDEGFGG